MDFPVSARGDRALPQPINYLLAQGVAGNCISLAAGFVDSETLPAPEVEACIGECLASRGRFVLQYGTTEGLVSLREKVRARLCAADGVPPADVSLDRVILSTGSQQMLYILTELMVDPGDIVITPAPTYFVYLSTLETAGAQVRTVPIDEEGMRIDAFRSLLEEIKAAGQISQVKIVYVTPYFQNPSGLSLSVRRRRELVETLESFEGAKPLVIEDAAYRELRFDGPDTPSIWSFNPNGRVAHLGTFSKPFSPGLRTGYAVLPEQIVEKVGIIKGNHDFGSPSFSQHIIDFFLENGLYDLHGEMVRRMYKAKCDLMCKSLETSFGDRAQWRRPGGGLYVWVDLSKVDTGMNGAYFKRCLENGVLYVPGEFAYAEKEKAPSSKMRLSFGPASPETIVEGVRRLAESLPEATPAGAGQ